MPRTVLRLLLALGCAAARLRLEVIHQHVHERAGRCAHGVLGAVATEHLVPAALAVHVRANGFDLESGPRHDRDVDAAVVVAVDQHRVLVQAAEQLLVEATQRRAVLRLDDPDTSASTSLITLAVIATPTSFTGSFASSIQPIQSPRPVAMISTSFVGSLGSVSNVPRFLRSQAHLGFGVRCDVPRRRVPRVDVEHDEQVANRVRVRGRVDTRGDQLVELVYAARIGSPAPGSLESNAFGRANRFSTLKDATRTFAIPHKSRRCQP